MRPTGLLILASCAILETYCASLAQEKAEPEVSKKANASSLLGSSSRQFSSLEPFLKDRARQVASRADSSQEPISSLTSSSSNLSESRARQFALSYSQVPPGTAPLQPAVYNYPANNVYYPPQLQQPSQTYGQTSASSPTAYHLPQTPYRASAENAYQPTYSRPAMVAPPPQQQQQQYEPISGGISEVTKVIYEQAEEKKSGLQYAAQLPVLHSVIELSDPNVRTFATKRGAKNSLKTVISFGQARRIQAPIVPKEVMQPEFYVQDDPISYSPEKAPRTRSSEAGVEQDSGSEGGDESNERESSGDEEEEEKSRGNERGSESEEAAEPEAEEREIDAQQAVEKGEQEQEVEANGALKLKDGELDRLDETAAKQKSETEDRDKVINDFGKDKLDKAGNFLEFGEKHATKLGKKAGLDFKTPDEAESEQKREPESKGLRKSKLRVTGDEDRVVGLKVPPLEVSQGEVEGKEGEEASSAEENAQEEINEGAR